MARAQSRKPDNTRSTAEARFRELVDELKLLTVAFPHLRDAFDPDELPVSFLLRQGADRSAARVDRVKKAAAKRAPVPRTQPK